MALINPLEDDVLLEEVEEEIPIGEHGEDVNPRHGAGNTDRRLFDDSAPKAPLKEQSTAAYIKSLEERINKKDEIILAIQEDLMRLKTEVHGAKKDNGRSHHRRPRQRSPTPERRTKHRPHAPEKIPDRRQELGRG